MPRLLLKLHPLFAAPTAFSKVQLSTLLIKTFERRAIDISEFLPTINARHIRCSVTSYKTQVKSCLAIINGVCYYCRFFVWPLSLAIILKSNSIVVAALNNHIINLPCLNHCGQKIDEYYFCLLCYHLIKQKKVLKFFFLNKVNIVMCQDYLPVLEILTLVEEMLIAWCYLVMSILKLWTNRALSLVAYQCIYSHAVIFPQSPGPLSIIFFSLVVKLHEHIWVIWFGISKPDIFQFKSFVSVKKIVVFHALL